MIELSPFTGCQHFPAFVKAESKLGLFPGNVQLQQAVDSFFGFGSLLVHFGQQLVGVYAMNQRYVRNDIFYFVCLQMPDEMPFYVFGQTFVFGSHFLHLTFSEHTLAGTIRFFYRLVGVKFGNSHQPYLFRQFAQYLF